MEEQIEVCKLTIQTRSSEDTISLYVNITTKKELFVALTKRAEEVISSFIGTDIDGDEFYLDLDDITFIGAAAGRIVKQEVDKNGYTIHRHIETNKIAPSNSSDSVFTRILERVMEDAKNNSKFEDDED